MKVFKVKAHEVKGSSDSLVKGCLSRLIMVISLLPLTKIKTKTKIKIKTKTKTKTKTFLTI